MSCNKALSGPHFLALPKQWWQQPLMNEANETTMSEIVKNPAGVARALTCTADYSSQINLSQIIKCDRFSDLDRLLRVTSYVLRFISNIKIFLAKETNVTEEEVNDFENKVELNARALKRSETLWIRKVQASSFSGKISYLQKGQKAKPRRVDQFILFLDGDQVLRCQGRINHASLQ